MTDWVSETGKVLFAPQHTTSPARNGSLEEIDSVIDSL